MTMNEMAINDDTLTLYYYRDGLTAAERARVQAALERDVALRERYEQLCADLGGLAAPAPVSATPDAVARWHDSIERAARFEHQRTTPRERAFHLPSFTWGAVVAAALVVGIGIGSYLSGNHVPEPSINDGVAGNDVPAPTSPSATFARGLAVHLQESRQELAGLPIEASSERAMLLTHMIQQNRMFERAAVENGSQDLARVLRAFEPILVQLAAEDISPEDAEALQAQLAFELNVVLTKYGRKASEDAGPI
jgi:hypothetical protein